MPLQLYEEVQRFIRLNPKYGYSSVADLVRDAVRRLIFDLGHDKD
jgi:Arc/MetJ-type ribon-helix-helix transcriptional regulator